jgi:hypothetical protein
MSTEDTEDTAVEVTTAPPAEPPAPTAPTYNAQSLMDGAAEFGIHPWDVAAAFSLKGVTEMTMDDFKAALEDLKKPLPSTESVPAEGSN